MAFKRNNQSRSPIGRANPEPVIPKVPQLNLGGHQGQEAEPNLVQVNGNTTN